MSTESRADYHQATADLILEIAGEFLTEDQVTQIKRRAAGRAGGRARGRRYRAQQEDAEKAFALGLEKDHPVVQYQYDPGPDGEFCGDCQFYIGDRNGVAGECLLVLGEIVQAGFCNLYRALVPNPDPRVNEAIQAAEAVRQDAGGGIDVPEDDGGAVDKADMRLHVALIQKATNDEEQTITGVVLQPDVVDLQDDVVTAGEIREAAHKFMLKSQRMYLQHQDRAPMVRIVENWLAHEDTQIAGQAVKAGSWLMVVKVFDDDLWARVKKGEFTGLSIRGKAIREAAQED